MLKQYICIVWAVAFISCSNDIEKVQELDNAQHVPSLRVKKLDGEITELGRTKAIFKTPLLLQYNFATEKHTDFPEGIEFYNYTEQGVLEGSGKADKAIYFEDKKLWEAKGNVQMLNLKGELLETEKLYWDMNQKIIYTELPVKITNKDAIINGVGLHSDEAFNEWEILKISNSTIYVDDKDK
jgi:LPS export ABC transporter protein LptC